MTDREWRDLAEMRLEGGYHSRDRTSFGAFTDACQIIWSLVVLAFLFLKLTVQIVLWAFGRGRKPESAPRPSKTPEEGKDEQGRPIWRYGY